MWCGQIQKSPFTLPGVLIVSSVITQLTGKKESIGERNPSKTAGKSYL